MSDSPVSAWQRFLHAIRRPFPWWPPVRDQHGPRDQEGDSRLDAEIAEFQRRLLEDALRDHGGVGGIPFEEGNEETAFLAHPGRLMCRAVDADERVTPFFDERRDEYVEPVTPMTLFGDLVRYDLPPRTDNKDHDVVRLLNEIDEVVGPEVAYPDHVIHVCGPIGGGKLCPATEPEVPHSQDPVPAMAQDRNAGAGVRVSVVDTGWDPDAAQNPVSEWLSDQTGHTIEGDPEKVVSSDIGSYVGHGTFVAGVIRCLAPSTDLEIEGVLKHAGAVYESDIAAELDEALTDRDHPALVSISAGTYTRNNSGLVAFEILSKVHGFGREDEGPLVVAAAGNEDTNRPFYPAAYDWVVGVGALDQDLCTPKFTNYGRWVDVWAHGTELVNAFPVGTYYAKEPGPAQGEQRDFTGLAQWSGTSFATPVVTGAIAAYMNEHPGFSARQAKAELFKNGKVFSSSPKVSKGIAVGPPFV
jgi:hypothetical protein